MVTNNYTPEEYVPVQYIGLDHTHILYVRFNRVWEWVDLGRVSLSPLRDYTGFSVYSIWDISNDNCIEGEFDTRDYGVTWRLRRVI
jgi:hypothetical protein